ncbi:GNAT family N-acetyltransferase [Leptospira idonii]|uniref:GNAT family N-acetyltransferase n=1 Tax=Leptospira idonii TaxID=1193500 RepID=A0A4R9M6I1_9LEPT|nr:GNAT family N-acetyltransferase [Leptospira idonii]TGN20769.1 GNAT family N-acetyltransferase [Leptospira idonii]
MLLRELKESDRNQTIELVNQFFRLVNELSLDGVFSIRPRAATKFTDIYFKLLGSGKVYMKGIFEKGPSQEEELVSLIIGRLEEKPHLVEERSLFIDLAVTKNGKKKKGYMKSLLADVDLWCKEKQILAIELRAILANTDAVSFWDHSDFERFYVRYRKLVK